MNIWSPDSLEQRLGRKVVPEGSNHFQRVLDIFLNSEDTSENNQTNPLQGNECNKNDGNYKFQNNCDENEILQKGQKSNELRTKIGEENNNSIFSVASCPIAKCQQWCSVERDRAINSNKNRSTRTKNDVSEISKSPEVEKEDSDIFLDLGNTEDLMLTMGASCSSNLYDSREWHNVKGDINIESVKPKKRGRLLKKRTLNEQVNEKASLYKPSVDVEAEKPQMPSDTCKCHQQESNKIEVLQPIRPQTIQANGPKKTFDKRTSLSPEDALEANCPQLTNNRLSPNVDSSGHIHISRIVGSGMARATAVCDVSPHRLTSRRSKSHNGRSTDFETKSPDENNYEERPRSQSWSNEKFGDKNVFKTGSLTLRQSLGISLKVSKTNFSVSADKSPKALPTSTTSTTKKNEKNDIDSQPQIKHDEVPTISISKALPKFQEKDDQDLAPISRRRAASESQTMRPHRILPRTPDSSDQIQEHVHVRWADEKKGSSLSTSVFLTNIRPRSRSYGAMDSVPHRPILKKVGGL